MAAAAADERSLLRSTVTRVEAVRRAVGDEIDLMLAGMLTEELAAEFETSKDLDFSFGWQGLARLRANAFLQRQSSALSVRLIQLILAFRGE